MVSNNSTNDSKNTLYAISLNFLSINAILQIYQSLIPLIMQRDFRISELEIGVVTGVVNLVVCLMLLIFSKMRPRLEVLVLSSLILTCSLMISPLFIHYKILVVFVILFYVGMMALSLTKVLSNDFTLQVAPDGKENSAMALTKIMSTLGGLLALLIMFFLNDNYVFYAMGLFNVAVIVILLYFRKNIHEKKSNETQTGDNDSGKILVLKRMVMLLIILLSYTVYDAIISTFSRYATNIWKMDNNGFAIYQSISLVAAFIAYIPIGKCSNKKNQKNFTILGLLLMAIGMCGLNYIGTFHYINILLLSLIGVGWAAIAVNVVPILVNGARPKEVSRLVGYYSVMSNISLIIAPAISGIILEYFSYQMLYYVLAAFLLISVIILLFYKDEEVFL